MAYPNNEHLKKESFCVAGHIGYLRLGAFLVGRAKGFLLQDPAALKPFLDVCGVAWIDRCEALRVMVGSFSVGNGGICTSLTHGRAEELAAAVGAKVEDSQNP